jgi:hypothetical protein
MNDRRSRRPFFREVSMSVLIAMVGLAAAGCSGDDTHEPKKANESQASPVEKGAIKDLNDILCAAKGGQWSGRGLLRNSSKKSRAYHVSFTVIRPATSDVLGRAEDTVTLEPNTEKKLVFKDFYKAGKGKEKCAPRVTYTAAE